MNTTIYGLSTYRVKRDSPSAQVFYLLQSSELDTLNDHER